MDVREKLVELIAQKVCGTWSESCDEWMPHDCGKCYANDCHISEIADHLISSGVTVQEWISVKDRLPEQPPNRVDEQGRSWFTPNIDCIVYDGKSVFAANYCFQNKCFWYADTLHPLKNITHWMPIPEPPKGE